MATGVRTGDLALDVSGLSKTFAARRILDDVNLQVRVGEIHALVGENGCGKSSLIKCLSGFYVPDDGAEVAVAGRPILESLGSESAGALGMSFVHQDLALVHDLSVMENVYLGQGFPRRIGRRIDWSTMERETRLLLGQFGHADIDPRRLVGDIPRALQTVVAMARCVHSAGNALMVLDEPTASLPLEQRESLFVAIRAAAASGTGVLYVTHHLDEVFDLADRVSVMRAGRIVATHDTGDYDHASLVADIVGRSLATFYPEMPERSLSTEVLRLSEVSGARVRDVDLSVHAGEIVGVTGLLGCGRSELGRLIFGEQRLTGGSITLEGKEFRPASPHAGVEAGIGYIPENRPRDGIFADLPVRDNITFLALRSFARLGRISGKRQHGKAAALIEQFDVRPPDSAKPMGLLSGGNQQKAVLAKWLDRGPRLLILDEPVQGIDIGAKAEVYNHIATATAAGAATLVLSSEVDDLVQICDRVIVLNKGRIVGEVRGDEKTAENISTLMYEQGAILT